MNLHLLIGEGPTSEVPWLSSALIPVLKKGSCYGAFWQGVVLWEAPSITVVSNLGPPDILGLQLPEILASRGGDEGFWEL